MNKCHGIAFAPFEFLEGGMPLLTTEKELRNNFTQRLLQWEENTTMISRNDMK